MHPPALPADHPSPAAGFWPRSVAWLIDAALVSSPVLLVMWLQGADRFDALAKQWQGLGTHVGKAMIDAIERGDAPATMLQAWLSSEGSLQPSIRAFVVDLYSALWPWLAMFALFALMYWPLQEASRHRATLGKRAMGLQAVAADGASLQAAQACKRHLAGCLSWLTLNIGHMLAANKPRHQALHDRIAKTQVVWRCDARREVPAWGWLLVGTACALPLVLAGWAARSLSTAMQAALGI